MVFSHFLFGLILFILYRTFMQILILFNILLFYSHLFLVIFPQRSIFLLFVSGFLLNWNADSLWYFVKPLVARTDSIFHFSCSSDDNVNDEDDDEQKSFISVILSFNYFLFLVRIFFGFFLFSQFYIETFLKVNTANRQ